MAYEIVRFPYDGTIDADGHVLEPATLWEEYLEARHRERALRIRVDDDGLEYLEIDGKPSERSNRGSLGLLGAMGDAAARPSPEPPLRRLDAVRRRRSRASASSCSTARTSRRACSIPTIGLLWECELDDPELTLAYQRAYNRWIADFCRDSRGRLVPIAHLTLLDPARLRRRARARGSRRLQGRLRRAVHAHAEAARASRSRRALRARRGARRADRDPSDLRAVLGRAGALQADRPRARVLLQRDAAPGRAAGVPVVPRARHARPLPGAAARHPRIGLGLDRLVPRPRRRRRRSGSGTRGRHEAQAERVRSARSASSRAIPTRPRRRTSSTTSAPTPSCGRPTTRTRIIPGTWAPALERFVATLSAETRAKVLGRNVARIYRLD